MTFEEFMRTLVVRMLKQFNGKDILTASDGASAVQALAKQVKPVDCIICDFNMDPVNGLMLLKAIRSGKASSCLRWSLAGWPGLSSVRCTKPALILSTQRCSSASQPSSPFATYPAAKEFSSALMRRRPGTSPQGTW